MEDAKAAQAGAISFTYSCLLILIALVAWMEPEDYQGMDVKVVEVCKCARYQNLRWVKDAERAVYCLIQFWIYLEALQVETKKVPRLIEESMEKCQRIMHFEIGPHIVYVHAWRDPAKKRVAMRYKMSDTKLEVEINGCPVEWREPISIAEASIEKLVDAPEDPV